jgi:hypothetical protein
VLIRHESVDRLPARHRTELCAFLHSLKRRAERIYGEPLNRFGVKRPTIEPTKNARGLVAPGPRDRRHDYHWNMTKYMREFENEMENCEQLWRITLW